MRNYVQLTFALLLTPLSALAACKLPVPDGGGVSPSKPNIFGSIERVELPYVFIRNGRTQQLEKVSLVKIGEIYSVYGGDAPFSDLQPRLQSWVWFAGCKRLKTGIPQAAYFQIFSSDPGDRAKLDRVGRIISVPPR